MIFISRLSRSCRNVPVFLSMLWISCPCYLKGWDRDRNSPSADATKWISWCWEWSSLGQNERPVFKVPRRNGNLNILNERVRFLCQFLFRVLPSTSRAGSFHSAVPRFKKSTVITDSPAAPRSAKRQEFPEKAGCLETDTRSRWTTPPHRTEGAQMLELQTCGSSLNKIIHLT